MASKGGKKDSEQQQQDAAIYLAFNKIVNFARDLNTQLQTPELVFIGRQGHGKSSLIESIIGHPFLLVGSEKGGCTKRPVFVNLCNNLDCAEPRITLKRDVATKEASNDKVLDMDDLETEMAKRNSITPIPIHITYEYKWCWNMTLIDTPGLIAPNEKSKESQISPEEIEEMIIDAAKPSHRVLIFVEDVRDGTQSEMIPLAKKVDPRLDRSIFVFNKFSEQFKNFTSTRELNRYLTSTALSDAQYFYTSLPSAEDRSEANNKDKFKKKLEDIHKGVMNALEQLQYDKRFANAIGVNQLKKHILDLTWSKYQSSIPELLKRLRGFMKKSEDSLQHITNQIKSLDSNKLRGNAARYVMQFLRNVEKLLVGTLEGNPAINGETTEEEKSQDDTGDWRDCDSTAIVFDPIEWKIPHAASKLYGGQQFERLLAEFKAVTDHISMETLTPDEIATAAGSNNLTNTANCTWAASDIAQRHIRRALLPLIDQLFKRSVYIMKRLVDVVDSMMEATRRAKRRSGRPQDAEDDLENFPFFTHAVKDFYFKFVDETALACKKKCVDEFLSTRIIHWELTNLDGKTISVGKGNSKSDAIKSIAKLSEELFAKIKERISKNVLLKSYNYFLVPMQTDLWGEIQGNITCMSDQQLEELFEVQVTKEKLADAEKDMSAIIEKFGEQEDLFMEYTNTFAKGITKYDL